MKQIFLLKPSWVKDTEVDFNFSREDNRFPGSKRSLRGIYKIPRKITYHYVNINKIDEFLITEFFYNMSGRQKSFYIPLWKNTFTCVNDILFGTYYIDITNIDFINTYNQNEFIFINTIQEKFFFYQISYVEKISTTVERIHLQTQITETIPKDTIEFCGKMLCVRFENDILEFTFHNTNISETTLSFIEMVNEYEYTE